MKKKLLLWGICLLVLLGVGCTISNKDLSVNSSKNTNDDVPTGSELVAISDSEGYGYSGAAPSKGFYAKKLIVIMMDGAANKGKIKKQVLKQLDKNYGVPFSYKWYYYTSPQSFKGVNNRLEGGQKFFGVQKKSIGVVLVGKSYGGARLYKYVYKNAKKLNPFYLVGVTYVDAHEPGAPGDEGKCGSWYDYVIFRCDSDAKQGSGRYSHYDLYRNVAPGLDHKYRQYRQYNIYQRNDWPILGYAFTRLGDRNHKVKSGHFTIINHSKTAEKIKNSISFALGQHHNPY